ncbi:MAG: amidohydrolase family protein [Thermoplasmata archaeon]|nr:amidohydrolase family protein [Thermoplasmata archaeon]
MIVEGAIVDRDGIRTGYVRFRGPRVIEVGAIGTDSTRGRVRRIHGIVVPPPVNSHTHLGDSVSSREPPLGPVGDIVGSPTGLKFRLLSETPRARKVRAMRSALARMRRAAVAATVDFREEGLDGVRQLREASTGSGVDVRILGRPLARPVDPVELDRLLKECDGIGLSSSREEGPEVRATIARRCRTLGKRYALHASEEVREPVDRYLSPKPDLLVHLVKATPDDLEAVGAAGVAVAVCPRSNALFGRRPDLARFEKLGLRMLLGTDNAMFHAPSIFRELEFAYVSSRLMERPVSPAYLARAAFVTPWEWLGEPRKAEIAPGSPATPIVLRLPTDDPAYQLVTRATEHVIVRPGTDRPGPSSRP